VLLALAGTKCLRTFRTRKLKSTTIASLYKGQCLSPGSAFVAGRKKMAKKV
jgi:hypothetical protein